VDVFFETRCILKAVETAAGKTVTNRKC